MLSFIIRRIFYGFITLFLVITLTFILLHSLPGDPFSSEIMIQEETKQQLYKKYNLDKPLHVQYFCYLKNLVKGDLGLSMKQGDLTVNEVIKEHFKYSFKLSLNAVLFAVIFGLMLGILSALYKRCIIDKFILTFILLGVSIPSFVISGGMQLFFGLKLGILPIFYYNTFSEKILPTISAGIAPMAIIASMSRASFLEVLNQDYIKTAKAKGLNSFNIIFKHCFRNAITPVISYVGQVFAAIATGSFVIEKIFVIPGLGWYYVESIENKDYTMVLGLTVFYAVFLITVLIIVDVFYIILDPRVRLASKG